MTENEQPRFSESQEQDEFLIAVEGYNYAYSWGIGNTTFFNEHSLNIRGQWLVGMREKKIVGILDYKSATIDVSQTDDDPQPRDDAKFHDVAPVGIWDMAGVGKIEATPNSLNVYVGLPRSGIGALLTMLSAEGHKRVFVVASKLEKQPGLSETAVGFHKTARVHRISFRLESQSPQT